MASPMMIKALSRAGEVNMLLQPYLHVMAAAAIVNTVLILGLVPLCRATSGWLAKLPLFGVVALSAFIIAELAALILVKQLFNVQHVGSRYTNAFTFTPSLGFAPRPNFNFQLNAGEITHTAGGYRGPDMPVPPSENRQTFLMIGGSSTYDLGLPDDQTWPTKLGQIFDDQIRVLNLGIPGHSTAEHIALAALVAWKYAPDVIVYYIGWNDIRSSHLGESTDYSRFHKKRMLHNFAITEPRSFFALGYVLKKIIVLLDELSLHRLSHVEIASNVSETIDERLLEIYVHNVRMLAAITHENGATPVFIPQILNNRRLTSDQPYAWIPNVPERALPEVLAVFNKAMIEAAQAVGAKVIPDVLTVDWQDEDFVDRGHFSERGAQRFACAVAKGLADSGMIAPSRKAVFALGAKCAMDRQQSASAIGRAE
jgi:lysophospholipase L1-like esterase